MVIFKEFYTFVEPLRIYYKVAMILLNGGRTVNMNFHYANESVSFIIPFRLTTC